MRWRQHEHYDDCFVTIVRAKEDWPDPFPCKRCGGKVVAQELDDLIVYLVCDDCGADYNAFPLKWKVACYPEEWEDLDDRD